MQCQICGALLSVGTTKCPSCGAVAPSDDVNSPYEIQEEVIPFIDYPARRTTTAGTPVAQAAPFMYGTSQVPARSTSVPPDASLSAPASLQPVEDAAQPHKSMPAGLAAVLVMLAFLLIGGGGFGYYLTKVQPAELNVQATAVVQRILTAQVQSSAEAYSSALAAFTAKSPQDIYNQVTGRAPDMSDPLSAQDSNVWSDFHSPILSCFFNQGAYYTLDTHRASYNLCPAMKSNFSNFAYQIQMRLLQGDGCGLLFRMDMKHNAYYRFKFLKTGRYSLYVTGYNSSTSLVASGFSNTIVETLFQLPSPSFTATIIAYESYIYLYINGQFLTKANDHTVASGAIGMSALSENTPTKAVFSNVRVWNL